MPDEEPPEIDIESEDVTTAEVSANATAAEAIEVLAELAMIVQPEDWDTLAEAIEAASRRNIGRLNAPRRFARDLNEALGWLGYGGSERVTALVGFLTGSLDDDQVESRVEKTAFSKLRRLRAVAGGDVDAIFRAMVGPARDWNSIEVSYYTVVGSADAPTVASDVIRILVDRNDGEELELTAPVNSYFRLVRALLTNLQDIPDSHAASFTARSVLADCAEQIEALSTKLGHPNEH